MSFFKKIWLFLLCLSFLYSEELPLKEGLMPLGFWFGLEQKFFFRPLDLLEISRVSRRSEEVDFYLKPIKLQQPTYPLSLAFGLQSNPFFSFLRIGSFFQWEVYQFFSHKTFAREEILFWPSAPHVELTQLSLKGEEFVESQSQSFWIFFNILMEALPKISLKKITLENSFGVHIGLGLSYWSIQQELKLQSDLLSHNGESGIYFLEISSVWHEEKPLTFSAGLFNQTKFLNILSIPLLLRFGFTFYPKQTLILKQNSFLLKKNEDVLFLHIGQKEKQTNMAIPQVSFFIFLGWETKFGALK